MFKFFNQYEWEFDFEAMEAEPYWAYPVLQIDSGHHAPAFTIDKPLFADFFGTPGDDTLVGTSGDDVFFPGNGNDIIDGGDGFDIVSYASHTGGFRSFITVFFNADNIIAQGHGSGASNFSDTLTNIEGIVGSSGDDSIRISSSSTFSEDFTFDGGAGNDFLGVSTIGMQTGNDTFIGGTGDDYLRGAQGFDSYDGGAGIDTVSYFYVRFGVAREEMLIDLRVNEITNDSFGHTEVILDVENIDGGSHLVDTLHGDEGNNVISGNVGGADNVFGHGGDDILAVTEAGGTIDGGSGNDSIFLFGVRYKNTDIDGNNIMDREDATNGVSINLATGQILDDGFGGSGTLVNIENIFGGALDDTLTGDAGDNRIGGGAGADTMDGGAGFDTLDYSRSEAGVAVNFDTNTAAVNGGAGGDSHAAGDIISNFEAVIGSEFSDFLEAGDFGNTLDGAGGDDFIYGGARDDILRGGTGNDQITTFSGVDQVFGGDGDDRIAIDGMGLGFIEDGSTFDGGEGIDIFEIVNDPFEPIEGYVVDFGAGIVSNLAGTATASITNFEILIGGEGEDRLSGNDGDNIITGRQGNDTIDGGDGVDIAKFDNISSFDELTITANADGSYTVDASIFDEGVDILRNIEFIQIGILTNNMMELASLLTSGDDVFSGTSGDDFVDAQGGMDILNGLGGDDRLLGGAGNDILNGGAGNDTLDGGTGTNIAVFSGASIGDYTITDLGGGIYTVTDNVGGDGTDTLSNIQTLRIGGTDYAIETQALTPGIDSYTGDSLDNTIAGLAGNDTMIGRGGNDILYGNAGDDSISGGAGDDQLFGGADNDTLTGNAGNDIL